MSMIADALAYLGFSPSEIKVYLFLVQKGSSYPNEISANTSVNRTNVYEALSRLVSKGVISYITRNKVKVFEAKSPGTLKMLIDEKKKEDEKNTKLALKDIERLSKSPPHAKTKLDAGIFIGRRGIKSLFEEMLTAGKPLHFFAADLQFRYFFGPYFSQWHKKRSELGIEQRTIFPETVRKKTWAMPLWKRKFIPKEYANPTTTIIYGDTCIFVQWLGEPLAIKIENPGIAKSHLNYFNLLWKIAKN